METLGNLDIFGWQERCLRAECLLSEKLTPKEIGRGHHIADLEQLNASLKHQIRWMQVALEDRNRQLYATGLIVRCTGCDAGKPFDGENLSEERVREVESLARRLRTWFVNHQSRKQTAALLVATNEEARKA